MHLTLAVLVSLMAQFVMTGPAAAQFCPGAGNCRKESPDGNLLYRPNSSGQRIWTSPCGSNTNANSLDPICSSIASCSDAGGFGKFLKAVTGDCKAKHFDGYFGLDGMTFGILDWTSSNLPGVLKAYQNRSPTQFDAKLGGLGLPMTNGCLDPKWTCRANQRADLFCKSDFRSAFASALKTPEFRKAQMDYAVAEYEQRLARYADLELGTEYGNTAIAVVANNLKPTASCKPSAWKAACGRRSSEKLLVDCMLDEYVRHECRGSRRASIERRKSIKEVFAGGGGSSTVIHPTTGSIEQCVADWSK